MIREFAIAPMSPMIRWLTIALFALPIAFILVALYVQPMLKVPAIIIASFYPMTWSWFRPTRFVVHHDRLEIVWPLRRCEIERREISSVRIIERMELLQEIGKCTRIGVGGLWGAFGWLWTQKRGIVRMYLSRADGLVWIERYDDKPWLITPEEPEAFVRALTQ